ncbi:MAG: GNAT family N-acetyltransferase [Planctomycetales bacterium]|nr:GNAT family N-acetyltransferase [Planctomycetales bacterium]
MNEIDLVTIRFARTEDLAAIENFLRPFIEGELLVPRTGGELLMLIRNGFVAEQENQIVGFAAVEIYSPKLAEVQCLAVDSRLQKRGIGKKLIEQCVQRASERGVRELMAITTSDNLFMSCGFDYSLPNQKRALFVQTWHEDHGTPGN